MELNKNNTNLERDLQRIEQAQKRVSVKSKVIDLRRQRRDTKRQLKETKTAIELVEKECEQANEKYRTDKATIFNQSQQDELARLKFLIVPCMVFVQALKIKCAVLQQAKENHDPQKDLIQWRQSNALPETCE